MIRLAQPADIAQLTRIAHLAFAPYESAIGRLPAPALQDFASDVPAGRVWVAQDPDAAEITGYVVAFARAGNWFLENVAVAPDAQGRGLGRALIAFAEAEGQGRGHARITLYTNPKMAPNLALYPALGYAETARRVEDGFDRVFFAKAL